MVTNSPLPKKKRLSNSQKRQSSGGAFEVEEIITFRLFGDQLKFLVSWKQYGSDYNSWEPFENLVNCTVFRTYVDEKWNSLEKEIFINLSNFRQRLKKRIREAMDEAKLVTLHGIFPFEQYEFKMMQAFYQLVPHSDEFATRFSNMVFQVNLFMGFVDLLDDRFFLEYSFNYDYLDFSITSTDFTECKSRSTTN